MAWDELSDAKVEAAAALLREWLIDGEGNRHDAAPLAALRDTVLCDMGLHS